jgi:hypothetical protein
MRIAAWARRRHPATGIAVLVLGVATASWAMTHGSMSELRHSLTAAAPHLFTRDGRSFPAPASLPPVLATESLDASISWTLTVLGWAALCWVATARQARWGRAWLPVTVGALAVAGQCALALSPFTRIVPAASWPGPTQPFDWTADARALTLHDPSALAPVVILLALAGAAWWGTHPARGSTSPAPTAAGGRETSSRALLVTGVPAVGLWLGAVIILVGTDSRLAGDAWLPVVAVEPGGSLLLLVVAAALTSGGGRAAALVLVGAQIAVTGPLVARWSAGAPDVILLACALSAGATACAAAWFPTARVFAEMAADPRKITMAPGALEP